MSTVAEHLHPLVADLLEAQENRNFSQGELAEQLKVSSAAITHWKRGRKPIAKHRRRIVQWLAGDEVTE